MPEKWSILIDKDFYVDCTTLISTPYLSGIQRVSIDLLSHPNAKPFSRNFGFIFEFRNFNKFSHLRSNLVFKFIRTFMRKLAANFPSLRKLSYSILVRDSLSIFLTYMFLFPRIKKVSRRLPESGVIFIPDIVRAKGHLSFLSNQVKSNVIPIVHDLIPINHPEFWRVSDYKIVRSQFLQYVKLIRQQPKVIVNSQRTKIELEKYLLDLKYLNPRFLTSSSVKIKSPKIEVLYPGSSLVDQSRQFDTTSLLESKLNDGTFNILLVGQLDTRKNFSFVFDLLPKLKIPKNIIINLEIVLGADNIRELRQQLSLEKLLEHSNSQSNLIVSQNRAISDGKLIELYKKSHLVLVPSLAEGFGLPLVEALAYQCNVIASPSAFPSELQKLFHIKSCSLQSNLWISKIREVLHDYYLENEIRLSVNRRDLAIRNFSTEAFRNRIDAYVSNIL